MFIQKDYNKASSKISKALKKGRKLKGWRGEGFKLPGNKAPQFEWGIADFVPGRFMTGHVVNMPLLKLVYKMLRCFRTRGTRRRFISLQKFEIQVEPHFSKTYGMQKQF